MNQDELNEIREEITRKISAKHIEIIRLYFGFIHGQKSTKEIEKITKYNQVKITDAFFFTFHKIKAFFKDKDYSNTEIMEILQEVFY